jgi:hypothetical protein
MTKTKPSTRCPWALRYGVTLVTRCIDGAGHLGSAGVGQHIGRGMEAYPYQRVQWWPGDRREFTTERNDRFSWEVQP